jgi:hypothetical protein
LAEYKTKPETESKLNTNLSLFNIKC